MARRRASSSQRAVATSSTTGLRVVARRRGSRSAEGREKWLMNDCTEIVVRVRQRARLRHAEIRRLLRRHVETRGPDVVIDLTDAGRCPRPRRCELDFFGPDDGVLL